MHSQRDSPPLPPSPPTAAHKRFALGSTWPTVLCSAATCGTVSKLTHNGDESKEEAHEAYRRTDRARMPARAGSRHDLWLSRRHDLGRVRRPGGLSRATPLPHLSRAGREPRSRWLRTLHGQGRRVLRHERPWLHQPHHGHRHGVSRQLPRGLHHLQRGRAPHGQGRVPRGGHHGHHHAHHQVELHGHRRERAGRRHPRGVRRRALWPPGPGARGHRQKRHRLRVRVPAAHALQALHRGAPGQNHRPREPRLHRARAQFRGHREAPAHDRRVREAHAHLRRRRRARPCAPRVRGVRHQGRRPRGHHAHGRWRLPRPQPARHRHDPRLPTSPWPTAT